jgi:hypothetical protein
MKLPSLKLAYLSWVTLLVVTTGYAFITGAYQSTMSLAVDKAGILPDGFSHQQMLLAFIAISLSAGSVLVVISGIFVWQASKNKKWAIWLLTIFALWQAYDSVHANFQLSEMYPGTIGICDWLLGITSSLIWLYVIFAAHKLKPKINDS